MLAAGSKLELTITRVFDAPRALVWQAWTDPKQLMKWWGPEHHPAVHLAMDVRPGRVWRNCLRSVETGKDLWHHGTFREVVPMERLVFTFVWEEEGERGMENIVTITFADEGKKTRKKTRMTLHQTPFLSVAERDGHGEGWTSSFGRLGNFLGEQS
jgi:uncharacterized protein YndB with AHSA1/START domain